MKSRWGGSFGKTMLQLIEFFLASVAHPFSLFPDIWDLMNKLLAFLCLVVPDISGIAIGWWNVTVGSVATLSGM